jgi:DNA-binding transcriptional MerR regulator
MTIGELAAKSRVPASTLRYWERMKVLPKPLRISGQRRYQPEAFNLVAVLLLAKACGFSLGEIRRACE